MSLATTTSTRKVTLQMLIANKVEELYLKSSSSNIIVDESTGERLSTRLESINNSISEMISEDQVDSKISEAINNLINGAPETYNTLKEIADYINSNEQVISLLNTTVNTKVDKVDGKGLSTNDFTDELKLKLENLSSNGTRVSASEINGNIKIDDVETVVYTHPTGDGYEHVPAGGNENQILTKDGEGRLSWADIAPRIRYGETTPSDLADGELFIKLEPEEAV